MQDGQGKKKCIICGRERPVRGGICEPCQERIQREARGEQATVREQAERELKKHGVTPEPAKERK